MDIINVAIKHVTQKFGECAGCRYNRFTVNGQTFSLIDRQAAEILCNHCTNLSNHHSFENDDIETMQRKINELSDNDE